uniref:Mitotic spindle assembly checkpoint protein MAD1 n=1 Tax=Sphaerodactylus townsendi TaxID=933632 RepID=A0ACB8FKF7_9SAUR
MLSAFSKNGFLIKAARDGMRGILDSYDSELSSTEHSPQLSTRVREAEDMVQKVEAHTAEMEVTHGTEIVRVLAVPSSKYVRGGQPKQTL